MFFLQGLGRLKLQQNSLGGPPHPAIVTIRDNRDYRVWGLGFRGNSGYKGYLGFY